jgi:Ala-tRNA(Pro) deacylase
MKKTMETAQNIDPAPLPTSPETLLARLDSHGIPYVLHHHRAVFTVSESLEMERDMPGIHCRNLFVRDKKERMFLISAANETEIDLKALESRLGCARLSFGSPERLWTYLGVRPGSVCPYAIVNDTENLVTPVLDAYMMRGELVNFHPLINTMTIGVAPDDLLKFIRSTGHEPKLIDF